MYYKYITVHSMVQGAVLLRTIFILGVDGKRVFGGKCVGDNGGFGAMNNEMRTTTWM
jgi:hypothetical protein